MKVGSCNVGQRGTPLVMKVARQALSWMGVTHGTEVSQRMSKYPVENLIFHVLTASAMISSHLHRGCGRVSRRKSR